MNSHPRKSQIFVTAAKFLSYLFTLKYRLFYRGTVTFGKNFITSWKFKIRGPGKVTFGDNIFAWAREEKNEFHTLSPDAKISIGNDTKLNGVNIQSQKVVTIGKGCILGSATIIDTDYHSLQKDRATNLDAPVISKSISIGDNVWIAGKSAVLKGVTIGDNAILGFGSVLRQNLPEDVIAIGNPAEVVRQSSETN